MNYFGSASLVFLALVLLVVVNAYFLDHFKSYRIDDLLVPLFFFNASILLAFFLTLLLARAVYRKLKERPSELHKKLFLLLLLVFFVPSLFLTVVAVVGESSYLRVFTDDTLKRVVEKLEDLEGELETFSLTPAEKERLYERLEELREEASGVRDLVRQQKLVLTNFLVFFLLVAVAVLAGAVLAASFLARAVTDEVERFKGALERVAAGDLTVRLDPEEGASRFISELRSLVRTFNKMVTRFAHLYGRAERDGVLFAKIFEKVSTPIALFDQKTGALLKSNPAYRREVNISSLEKLREWARLRDPIRYEEHPLGGLVLAVVEDLKPVLISKRYRAWREIASRLAHDVKNPLHSIMISVETLTTLFQRYLEAQREGKEAEALRRLVEEKVPEEQRKIEKNARYITELINAFNNLSSEEEELKRETFSLRSLLFELKRIFETDRFKVYVEVSPFYVYADRQKLRRVFENLIKNAAEATERAGLPVGIVRIRTEGNRIHVVDNGPGIPPDKVDSVFLPFTSTKGKGRGLGLFIAKKLVEEHGWSLSLLPPRKGEGAHFVIEVRPEDLRRSAR
ncbi:MAG: HAMP domain-containing protein [Aquificae bacterium]|nr:HAMP domain-containing protein [Aquificota bacterium]